MHTRTAATPSAAPARVAFVMEQTLGHVAYTRNLQRAYADEPVIRPTWLPVPFEAGPLARLPIAGNWTVRGSARGGARLLNARLHDRFDAALFHTQTVALLAPLAGWRLPVIVSLDATPLNFDAVGRHYGHATGSDRAEAFKRRLHGAVFRRAAALTTWCEWAKRSLRDDYGVDPDRVSVIPPGVDLDLFAADRVTTAAGRKDKVSILFVGGDFARKGGPELLRCMRDGLAASCELHVVTREPVPATPGVHVYSGLGPNDPALLALYRAADIFALPTHADCLAVVLGEAMAAGLPVITTTVGAQPEAVRDGETGLLVRDGDVEGLGAALRRLAVDPELRRRLGRAGRRVAEQRYDARRNARLLAETIAGGIERWRARSTERPIAAIAW